MAPEAPAKPKINTTPTQPGRDRAARRAPGKGKTVGRGRGPARVSGVTRESVRGSARVVVEAGCGVLVYPPEAAGEPWRATFTENGRRRFRQAATEAGLAAKLAKVTERLRAGARNMERPGADLIAHYLDPDRLAVVAAARRHPAQAVPAVRCPGHRGGHLP